MTRTIFHRQPPTWLDEVKHLKPGGRKRIGDGKLVSFNGRGYHLYDFREKESEVYEPQLSLAERLAIIAAQRDAALQFTASIALPDRDAMPHPKDWPLDARVWFYRAGISNDEIAQLGAFWSPGMARVVLPYRTLDGTDAWIARDPAWTKDSALPKYLFPAGAKRGGGAVWGCDPTAWGSGFAIVEDALSAYRIGRDAEFTAVAAQGTSLDRDAVVRIAVKAFHGKVPVVVWLDPDKYGQLGATKLATQFANLGVTVRNIVSDRDPKLHEPHEIREALEC